MTPLPLDHPDVLAAADADPRAGSLLAGIRAATAHLSPEARPRIDPAELLRAAAEPRAAAPPRPGYLTPIPLPKDRAVIHGFCNSWSGYGRLTEHFGRGLESLGVPASYRPLSRDETFRPLSPWQAGRIAPAGVEANLHVAPPDLRPPRPGMAVLTMWESSRIRPEHVANLSSAAVVVVPSRFNVEGFRASGLKVPVVAVGMGTDPAEYSPAGPPPEGVCRFGMAARMAHGGVRKGLSEGIAAFLDAFPDERDVELAVKIYPDCHLDHPGDPRVVFDRTPLGPADLRAWYSSLTALLVPSKGEGWGMHSAECLACARPVIACLASAAADFVTPDCSYPLEYDWAPAGEFYAGMGEWHVPRHASMVARLREVYGDRATAARKGEAAAIEARRWTWEKAARGLKAAMERHGVLDGPAASPKRAEIRAHAAEIQRIKRCPSRRPSGCGCQKALCLRDDREVYLSDCRSGVAAGLCVLPD